MRREDLTAFPPRRYEKAARYCGWHADAEVGKFVDIEARLGEAKIADEIDIAL